MKRASESANLFAKHRTEVLLWLLFIALFGAGVAVQVWHGPELLGTALRVAGVVQLVVWAGFFRCKVTPWIVAAMFVGIEVGLDAPAVALGSHFLSEIFLRLIKTIVAPLILATLVSGIAGHGDLKSVGRLGVKSIVYFEVITTLALVIGLVAINISKAGVGMGMTATPADVAAAANQPHHWQDFLVHVVPENIAKSIAEGQVLQVAVFALLFGMALAAVSPVKRAPLLHLAESLTETMFRFTNLVMYAAPLGVGAAMANVVAKQGPEVLLHLGKLLLTLYVALAVFALCVLLPVALIAKIDVRRFLKHVWSPATIAFATASSEAALPRAMEEMEAFGVPRNIVAFVIPTGYSFNLEGSTLYLALAMGFVAQAGGVQMTISQQVFMMLTLMISSKGIAGVPRATLVVLSGAAVAFHLPAGPIGVLLGIDALMDMGRTMISVVGNSLATAVMARWEGQLGEGRPSLAVQEGVAE